MATYNRLNPEDTAVSTDKVVSNTWSNDVNILTTQIFTASVQAASTTATSQGNFFIEGAQKMILKGASVNDMYFVCPVFNQLVLDNKRIVAFNIPSDDYHSLMSPKLVDSYIKFLEGR